MGDEIDTGLSFTLQVFMKLSISLNTSEKNMSTIFIHTSGQDSLQKSYLMLTGMSVVP